MPKTKISEYSQTPIGNEDVGNIGITGEAPVSNIDDALQTIMAHLADMNAGTSPLADTFTLSSTISGQGNVRFDASQVGNSTTQVLTVPNASGSLVISDENGALIVTDGNGDDVEASAMHLNGLPDTHYLDAENLTGTILDANLPATIASDISGNAETATNASVHVARTDNPHNVTLAQIGLGNVDNTSDLDKIISEAVQSALDEKLSLSGGTMAGNIDLNGYEIIGLVLLPIGSEMPWQNETSPAGWFIQDGSTFDAATYPLLAAHLGGNTLPDMRGVVPRGLDSGRGFDTDANRALGNYQDDTLQGHSHTLMTGRNDSGDYHGGGSARGHVGAGFSPSYNVGGSWVTTPENLSGFGDVRISAETRMKNISKIWLIKHD